MLNTNLNVTAFDVAGDVEMPLAVELKYDLDTAAVGVEIPGSSGCYSYMGC